MWRLRLNVCSRWQPAKARGFTLIELMIVVAIVAILAAVAMPSYNRYMEKSQARAASADLVALSLVMENRFQKTLLYPSYSNAVIPASVAGRDSDMTRDFSAWTPTQGALFDYTVDSDGAHYTLIATRKNGSCTLSMDAHNVRDASACKVLGSW
ncbi:prepilin-type N-terminal cleavage/methylation domain-containing protein [Comamonas sp. CMM02]|jgi:type IV pilus assembly protein PilE|nr:prepilin-type N-terminal cleavage/methylation domain-containing protein [Comamonas sp. CMM02]